jgi:hypothetical protein
MKWKEKNFFSKSQDTIAKEGWATLCKLMKLRPSVPFAPETHDSWQPLLAS